MQSQLNNGGLYAVARLIYERKVDRRDPGYHAWDHLDDGEKSPFIRQAAELMTAYFNA
jgi:hypothetical protein